MATRRDILKGATLAAAATAAASLGATPASAATPSSLAPPATATPPLRLGKITLEEHFLIPEFFDYFADQRQNVSPAILKMAPARLQDFDNRLEIMDRNQVDYQVLSVVAPGVQVERDTAVAIKKARFANDFLAGKVQKLPTRFGGFAHLPMQDPTAAADELARCIGDLKFHGALINGQTNGDYLDHDKYSVFWERAAALQAPIYIHPGNSADHPAVYDGHPELWGPLCSWAFETGTHALRLVFAGVFERYPQATVVLGHMGETLPLNLWRFDSRWPISVHGSVSLPQPPSFYIRRNIAITTSGVCSDISLRCALDSMGTDRVLFSVDYPFEKTEIASQFLNEARVSEAERRQVASENAKRILHITHPIGPAS